MKRTRTYLLAAGLLTAPLLACGSHPAPRMTSTTPGGLADKTRLGAGDPVGSMLQDYYIAHLQGREQAEEAIVLHESTDAVDPAP